MRWARRADGFFLVASLAAGSLFVFLTPPFQVPDEPVHFYRAFALAEGHLTAERWQGRIGAELPASVPALFELFADVPFHPERRVAPGAFAAARALELDPDRRQFVDFPAAAAYTVVPYLPQAAGIALGRLVGAPPLVLFYLARLANLLVASLLTWLALRCLPSYRWLAVLVALAPMALFQRASVSADALTLAAAFLFAASVAGPAFSAAGALGRRQLATLTLSAAVFCLSKAAYLPLLLTPLLIPRARFPRGRRVPALLVYGAVTGLALLVAVLNARSVDLPFRPGAGVDPDRQIAESVAEPLRFLGVVVGDWADNAPRFAAELIGRLGWLDTPLPFWLLAVYALALLALAAVDSSPELDVGPWQRAFLAALVAGTLVMISASQYALWTPVGAAFIEGTQGRHFLPVVPVAIWVFHIRRWASLIPGDRRARLTALVCILSVAVTAVVLFRRYYL